MPRKAIIYTLTIIDLPPLTAPGGRPVTVPCTIYPFAWDEDAPVNVRRNAAHICRTQCEALQACTARLLALGPAARGVMAGRIVTGRGDLMDPPSGTGHRVRRLPPLPPEIYRAVA
jgi:hypothetical protein